jgi:prepilin-type N-terminal cleavage/methylation domain-containing protein
MQRPWRHQAGYTLTEMLVVLVLISFVTAIGPVAILKLLPGAAVNSAAQTLSADLELLRVRAMVNGSEGRLLIDPSGTLYEMRIDGALIKHRYIDNSVRISIPNRGPNYQEVDNQSALIFASAAGRLRGERIVLSRGEKTKTVEINTVFGTAQIAK